MMQNTKSIKGRRLGAMRTALRTMLAVTMVATFTLAPGCVGNTSGGGGGALAATSVPVAAAAAAYPTRFASFNNYERTTTNSVKPYTIAAGGANIVNINQFTDPQYYWIADILTDEALGRLVENGFVVSDIGALQEYWIKYSVDSLGYIPSFITTDATIHTYRLLFDKLLRDIEEDQLLEALGSLSRNMVIASQQQYQQLKGTEFETAALRNIAFFSVGAKLADGGSLLPEEGFQAPAEVAELVSQELALIASANTTAPSPIINYGQDYTDSAASAELLDYTQFIPRAHYTRTPALMAYWQMTKWYGQATLRTTQTEEVKSALLLCNALLQGENEQPWYKIFDTINFFVGECNDLTFYQYLVGTKEVYGEDGLKDLAVVTDADTFAKAVELIENMLPPQINSLPGVEIKESSSTSAATGLRFLGERFTIDSAIFQKLIDGSVSGRSLPTALDIPAAFGSTEAVALLEDEGVMSTYPDYATKLKEAQDYFAEATGEGAPNADGAAAATTDAWTSNLYWSWLYMLQPLVDNNSQEGLPSFMTSQAWTRKELNTFEGSWTELRHDTEAYTESVGNTGGRGAGPGLELPPPPDDRGYVEPNPLLFGRLASLCQMTIDGLAARNMIALDTRDGLEKLRYLADTCATISEKELADSARSDAEYDFIRSFGKELNEIFQTARVDDLEVMNQNYAQGSAQRSKYSLSDMDFYDYARAHPAGVVTSVASNSNSGLALEEATGLAQNIYVVFPRDGELVIGRGTVYSQYEFTVASSERMTDDNWHQQLLAERSPSSLEYYYGIKTAPSRIYSAEFPSWKASYMADALSSGNKHVWGNVWW